MMENDCYTCVYGRMKSRDDTDNGCTSWGCNYINRQEAINAYKKQFENDKKKED